MQCTFLGKKLVLQIGWPILDMKFIRKILLVSIVKQSGFFKMVYISVSLLGDFELDQNLYFINNIEWAASAMEMSAVGAKNVANLAYNSWADRVVKPSNDSK